MHSAIYKGEVVHRRFKPREHRLNYRVFSLLLNLDELDSLNGKLKLFGYNRRALFSFYDKDHGTTETGVSLKSWVFEKLSSIGLPTGGMRVSVLCYPRIFGYVFNPLTVYFCYRPDGTLAAILYEVCNTFHERHTYIIPVSEEREEVRHRCAKELYVSPFMPMECTYHFQIEPPKERVAVRINETTDEGRVLYAAFEGERSPLTDKALAGVLLKYPLMTIKVMVAIHWEALQLWRKGIRFFKHSPAVKPVATSHEGKITTDEVI